MALNSRGMMVTGSPILPVRYSPVAAHSSMTLGAPRRARIPTLISACAAATNMALANRARPIIPIFFMLLPITSLLAVLFFAFSGGSGTPYRHDKEPSGADQEPDAGSTMGR